MSCSLRRILAFCAASIAVVDTKDVCVVASSGGGGHAGESEAETLEGR